MAATITRGGHLAAALLASLLMASPALADLSSTPQYELGTDGAVSAVASSGNRIFLGGQFSRLGPATGPGVAVSTADSSDDLGLPRIGGGWGDVVAVVSDGAGGWFVGGDFTHVGGTPEVSLVHIKADKTIDTSFAPSFSLISPCAGLAVIPTIEGLARIGSTLYVTGEFTSVDGQARQGVVALDSHGALTSFDAHVKPLGSGCGLFNIAQVGSIAAGAQGIYLGGATATFSGQSSWGSTFISLDASTGALRSWSPAIPSGWRVYSNAPLTTAGSRLYVGLYQEKTTTCPNTCAEVAAFSETDGSLLWETAVGTSSSPHAWALVSALVVGGITLYIGGQFSSVAGTERTGLAALDSATGAVTSWSPPSLNEGSNVGEVTSIGTNGTTVYVTGGFDHVGGEDRYHAAAFSAASAGLMAWNPAPAGYTSLVADGGEVYLYGLTTIHSLPRQNLAAVDASTGAILPWNASVTGPPFETYVTQIIAYPSTVYVKGSFSSADGEARAGLAAFDASSGAVTSWNPAPMVAMQGYMVGYGSSIILGSQEQHLVQVTASDGALFPWRSCSAGRSRLMSRGNWRRA